MKLKPGEVLNPTQLSTMLDYHNENVISRFTGMFDITPENAEDIFIETRKFLYLCQLPGIYVTDDLVILDEMWHNFILFTKDYQHFCDHCFGGYFHHLPASKKEKEEAAAKAASNQDVSLQEYKERMRFIMGAVYDNLGPETVLKWFQVYPEKFSKQSILQIRK